MANLQENIEELSFSNVMGDRFGRYSKYIIQDRALPDIRDGLKPVQRRILYAMYRDHNTAANPYRKSAKTVGNVIGNYHPHGDTSVYEAMVRMSQEWKNRVPLIDMHGNKGSMDGDPPAAMRYTEARLTAIASTLLQDLDFDTVDHGLNFDDTLEEPLVLPARFPNLLVNGATGISAGYATEIPPHNLGEVIDAIIHILTHPEYQLKDLMTYIQGPDFPTGAILQGADSLEAIYQTGRGKVTLRATTHIEPLKGGKSQIVATHLPYDINKSKLIQRLDDIRLQHKIDGIVEIRDESDRTGVRLVIELKRDADSEGILNYLFKHTELQAPYHFNMVAIHQNRPVQAGLPLILEAYIQHRREVIRRRTQYLKAADQKRLHIVDGLIKVISILDEVIQTIRSSEHKQDAKENLVSAYDFSLDQAEAIVNLQLYRLTNTDIVALQNERLELNERIRMQEQILSQAQALNKVFIDELKAIKKAYATPRLTQIEDHVEEITIDSTLLVAKENVIVSVTQGGYLKRTSSRSFTASDTLDMGSREGDFPLFVKGLTTYDAIVVFTNRGHYLHIPVNALADKRWKDLGVHLSQDYMLEDNERILAVFQAYQGLPDTPPAFAATNEPLLLFTTQMGKIKQSKLSDFTTYRSYKTRTADAITLEDGDQVVSVIAITDPASDQVLVITQQGYGIRYDLEEVPVLGIKAKGVKALHLQAEDQVVTALLVGSERTDAQIVLVTHRSFAKRMKVAEISVQKRPGRGLSLIKVVKQDPHQIIGALLLEDLTTPLLIQGDTGYHSEILPRDLPLSQRGKAANKLKEAAALGNPLNLYIHRLKRLDQELQGENDN